VVGILRGFDQFLNLVLDEATSDNGDEEPLGMVVVRGNSVTAMEALEHIPAAVRKA
jgi:small nuclear ribonucleoprotein G